MTGTKLKEIVEKKNDFYFWRQNITKVKKQNFLIIDFYIELDGFDFLSDPLIIVAIVYLMLPKVVKDFSQTKSKSDKKKRFVWPRHKDSSVNC